MSELVYGVVLSSTSASSSITLLVEWEIPIEEWVTGDMLDTESFFATDCSDVHTVVEGLLGATIAEDDWVVSVPNKEERICDTYEPDQIPMY